MTGEVLPFPQRKPEPGDDEPLIWTCDCGSTAFQAIQGGAIRCARCRVHSTVLRHFEP